jgi:hypothetical protein
LFQAAPAARNGPDPAPEYIRAELISGSNAVKSNMTPPSHAPRRAAAALAASVAAYEPPLALKTRGRVLGDDRHADPL